MAIVLSPPPSSIISLEVWCDTATTAASPLISHLYISLVFHNLDINVHIRRIILDLNSMLKDHLNMESYLTLGCGMLVNKVSQRLALCMEDSLNVCCLSLVSTFAATSACDWLSWLTEFQLTNHRQRSQQK